MSVPVRSRRRGGTCRRTEEGSSYPIHCRGRSATTRPRSCCSTRTLEADGHEYFDVGAFDVSPDHRCSAWSLDTDGGEHYTLRVRDLDHRRRPGRRDRRRRLCGMAWSRDGDVALLRHRRRPGCARTGLAPRARHRTGRRRAGLRGDRRALLRRHRLTPQRDDGSSSTVVEQDEQRDAPDPRRRPDGGAASSYATARRTSSTTSTTGATGS